MSVPQSRHHRPYRVGMLAALPAAVVGLAAWWVARRLEIPAIEVRLFRVVNGAPDALWLLLWPIMQLGNRAAPIVVAAVAGLVWRSWRPPVSVLLAGYGAWQAAELIKHAVGRGRPAVLIDTVRLRETAEGMGFVSGHAAVAAAIATALWPHLDQRGRVVAGALAATVGVARMHAGVHLPLDVAGGGALGIIIGLAVTTAIGIPRSEVAGVVASPER